MRKISHILSSLFLAIAVILFACVVGFLALGNNMDDVYIFGYKPFIVSTGSMETEYMTYSTVIIQKDGFDQVEIGDVIAFQSNVINNKIAFHRVVDKVSNGFITKGDNNSNNDEGVVSIDNYIGHEVFHTNWTAFYIAELLKPGGTIRMVILPILAIALLFVGFYLIGRWTNSGANKWVIFSATMLLLSIAAMAIYAIWDIKRIEHINTDLQYTSSTFFNQSGSGVSTTLNGKEVLGVISIDKIDVEYPIIEYENESSLNLAVTKYFGAELNTAGNVVLAGHRSTNGSNLFFTNINQLRQDDIVTITDKSGRSLNYVVTSYSAHSPDDLSVLSPMQPDSHELTLISCTEDLNDRYVVKLISVIDV